MPSNDCRLPPGREDEIIHNLPVIPPGLWPDFRDRGTWPQGIQRELDQTRDCPWVPLMAQVRFSSVVAEGRVVQLATPILGLLPRGWYKHPVEPSQPTAPAATLERYREIVERAPLGTRSPTASGTWGAICPIPVPTLDLLMPYPFITAPMDIQGRSVTVKAGELGALLWRLPGSDHPLFSTGAVISQVVPAALSPLGLAWLSTRAGGINVGMPGSLILSWLDNWYIGSPVRPADTLYHFQASHMQCLPRLHTAQGVPIEGRWHFGGSAPAARRPGEAPDWFEVRMPGSLAWRSLIWPVLRQFLFDAQGRNLAEAAAEFPFGTNQFNGPPPGSFLTAA